MRVTIEFPEGPRTYEAGWLEVTRLVGGAVGIADIDVESFPNKVTVKADGVNVTGETLEEACAKFCRQLSES